MTSDLPAKAAAEPSFSQRVVAIVLAIPRGKVVSYGQIAAMAGNPQASRQVVRALNSNRGRGDLPWFRIVNRDGQIALPPGEGFELQQALLRAEGVPVDDSGRIAIDGHSAFAEYRWVPGKD